MTSQTHLNALPLGYELHEYRIEALLDSGGFGLGFRAKDRHQSAQELQEMSMGKANSLIMR